MFLKISSFAFWKKNHTSLEWHEHEECKKFHFKCELYLYTFLALCYCIFSIQLVHSPSWRDDTLSTRETPLTSTDGTAGTFTEKIHPSGRQTSYIKTRLLEVDRSHEHKALEPSKNSHDRKTRILQKERSAIKHKTCPQQNKLQDFSSRLKNTTRNALLLFSTPRAWHLTSPEHSSEDRKCFLCIFSPGTGRGETWTPFSYVEPVNSLWTSGTAKRSFSPHPNGFTLRRPTTNMTSSLDCKTSKLWV